MKAVPTALTITGSPDTAKVPAATKCAKSTINVARKSIGIRFQGAGHSVWRIYSVIVNFKELDNSALKNCFR